MSYDILRQELKKGIMRGLYLFYGPEEFLIQHYLADIENRVVAPFAKEVSVSVYDGRPDPGALHNACAAYPLLGDKRLVVVNNSGLFKPGAEGAEGKRKGGRGGAKSKKSAPAAHENKMSYNTVIEDLPDFTCLIFIEQDVDRRLSLYNQIAAKGLAVEFAYRDPAELEDWARAIAGREGKKFTREAIRYFIENAGESMTGIRTELEKLLTYTVMKQGITLDDVMDVCSFSLKTKIFDLLDNVLSGRKRQAISELDAMLRGREPVMRVLSVLSNHLVLLRQMKVFSENGVRLSEVTQLMGLNSYRAEKLWRQIARVSPQVLARAIAMCCEQDIAIKSGRVDDETALRLLVFSI